MASGIPYFTIPAIDLGPIELQPFGILVATGVIFGAYLMRRWGETRGLDDDHIRGLVTWTVVCGFIGAHVFDVIAYQPDALADDPLLLFKLWKGISSYGGFIGGTLGFLYYATKHKLPLRKYMDAGMIAFVPGFTFGRMACSIVHDHVGARTDDFFLATYYTKEALQRHGYSTLEPGLHHNLGFYELLYMLVLCALMYGMTRMRNRPDGLLCAVMATAYAPVRFFLEFFRDNPNADPRYAGFTFAQWMSLVLVALGVLLSIRIFKTPRNETAEAASAGADEDVRANTAGSPGKSQGQRSGKANTKPRKQK